MKTGVLTFGAGVVARTVDVSIADDTVVEYIEQFTVTLSSPANAIIAAETATVSIVDDDRKEPTSGQRGADFDGDHVSDPAVWNSTTGVWTIKNSATGTITSLTFGLSGDVPVVGDYNGDGRADQAIFRPSNSGWYINLAGVVPVVDGAAGDLPVQADL